MYTLSADTPLAESPPSRAAWIEMRAAVCWMMILIASPPSRAAWIEIAFCQLTHTGVLESPPSRAAWIEIPLSAIISAMYRSLHSQVVWIEALRLCDLPSLGIFINQKQGYCILDAATLFSEKTVIGEQRYSTDNVYRLSHIAMFVKSFPLKTAGSVLPNRCPENCRQSKYDRLGSRAQLLSRKKSEFDNGFCGSCLKFAYNKIMMLCAQYYKY